MKAERFSTSTFALAPSLSFRASITWLVLNHTHVKHDAMYTTYNTTCYTQYIVVITFSKPFRFNKFSTTNFKLDGLLLEDSNSLS